MATNFTGSQQLQVGALLYKTEALVCIRQGAGSLHFQFDMTPQQAREMAAELLAEAVKAEAMAEAMAKVQEIAA